ncbi:ABC transporter substrate-binding protein [Devosia nitrariae]|uniref:ABC transporter substrate-binding protein n=1 Tax=Devosia nitrariae TaxID=2071872 RepID=A0ABQ5W665_9HYPH|nr:ABC transporter substrate-binding protein [Devosia nitrariae]GLQ55425.1 ABC transporter substrate-binding protein [Devosia nitrariae]
MSDKSLTLSRRELLLGVAASSLALGFAGVSSRAFGQDQQLVFWSQFAGSKRAAGEALETAFKAAHPERNLVSTLYAEPPQLNEKILTSINGNTAPDLFVQHWDYNLTYAAGDRMLDLGEALDVDMAALDPSLLAYGHINGAQYSIPMYGTSRGIGFNRAYVIEAGLDPEAPPTTWAEFRDWAIALTKRHESGLLERAGFSMFHNDLEAWEVFTLFLQGAGGTLLNEDLSAPTFAGPEGVKALTFLHGLLHEDKVTDLGFGLGPGGLASPFNSGRASMIIAGNYSTNNALRAGIEFDLAPIPKENGGYTSLVDPFCYAVPRDARNVEGAVEFIAFALTPEQQVAFAVESKNVPVLKSAQQDPAVQADPYLAKFVETASYAPAEAPAIPAFSRLVTIIARAVQEAMFNRTSVEDALAAAANEVQTILDRG